MWNEAAIKSMGVGLSLRGIEVEGSVDVAGSAVNFVDECQKLFIDPGDLLEVIGQYGDMQAILDGVNDVYGIEVALISPIGTLLLNNCRSCGVDVVEMVEMARESLSGEGWKDGSGNFASE